MSEKICNGCTNEETCETQELMNIPFVVHEKSEARHERREKRYITALIIAFVLLFISNAIWLWAWMQYDYVSEEYSYVQDGQGYNVMGTNNEVIYGAETDNTEEIPQEEANF